MKSGLEGRNNLLKQQSPICHRELPVSMKSGLEGRNNPAKRVGDTPVLDSVSMKSGLEGRNNRLRPIRHGRRRPCLNEVRPRRPEQ